MLKFASTLVRVFETFIRNPGLLSSSPLRRGLDFSITERNIAWFPRDKKGALIARRIQGY